jgi:beta-phosphoglucomutase
MSQIKAAIFDLDGVIVDTAKYHYLAWRRLATELGFEFTVKDNERLKGVSRMTSLEILLEVGNLNLDENTKLKLAEKKNNWYVEYINKIDESELLQGAKEYIIKLREKGIKTALGSASKNAPMILKNLGILNLFDVIVDGNSVIKTKPNPEVFIKAAELLGVEHENCIVFEDAEAGVIAAKSANMKCIGIGSKDILHMADYVIAGLFEASLEL